MRTGAMTNPNCRLTLAILLAAGLVACGESTSSLPEQKKVGPVAGEAAVDKPLVGFRQAALTIDRLERPIAPPVTPGSSPSSTTLVSGAPEVVSIQADGSLVAHRNGRATIRALQGGGSLMVDVLAASGLRAEPPSLRVGPGIVALPALTSGDTAIPAGSATWYSNAPDVAMVEDGRIRAGPAKGTAILTAMYGDENVQVAVVVVNREARRK